MKRISRIADEMNLISARERANSIWFTQVALRRASLVELASVEELDGSDLSDGWA